MAFAQNTEIRITKRYKIQIQIYIKHRYKIYENTNTKDMNKKIERYKKTNQAWQIGRSLVQQPPYDGSTPEGKMILEIDLIDLRYISYIS